jgi:hypothetical protein
MSEFNNNNNRKPMSAYQQLSGIISALKSEEMSLNDAMNKIQLKEMKPTRPYCKVTGSGALALYGISKQPLVLYADQWNKLLKVAKSDYMDNYIKYNQQRLKFKRPPRKQMNKESSNENLLDESQVEQIQVDTNQDDI